MKALLFAHKGLSTPQKGVQIAHVVSAMVTNTRTDLARKAIFDEWNDVHRTIHFYDGGFSGPLARLYQAITSIAKDHGLPYAQFFEDDETFDCIRTAVGIVVPDLEKDPNESPRSWLEANPDKTSLDLAMDKNIDLGMRIRLLTHGLEWAK